MSALQTRLGYLWRKTSPSHSSAVLGALSSIFFDKELNMMQLHAIPTKPRRHTLGKIPALLGDCIAALALAACSQQGAAPGASAASGDQLAATVASAGPSRLVFATVRNVGPLNPHMYSPNEMYAQNMVYEPLVKYTKEGKIIPWLTESWKIHLLAAISYVHIYPSILLQRFCIAR